MEIEGGIITELIRNQLPAWPRRSRVQCIPADTDETSIPQLRILEVQWSVARWMFPRLTQAISHLPSGLGLDSFSLAWC